MLSEKQIQIMLNWMKESDEIKIKKLKRKCKIKFLFDVDPKIDNSEIESGDEVPAVQRSRGEEEMVALTSLGFDENKARKVVVKILKEKKEIDTKELLKKELKEIRK